MNKILGVFDPYPPPGCSHLLLNVNIFLKFLTPTLPLAVHVICEWPQSAKVMHGRQFHLDGDFFENLFIHFTIEKDYAKYKAISEETLVKKL